MSIKIVGALSAFGALAVALFIVSGGSSALGLQDLSNTTSMWANIVILIVIMGAVLAMASKFHI